MCHWNVGLIKINILNIRDHIYTVECKTFPSIITVTLLKTRINEWTEDFFPSERDFIGMGSKRKLEFLFLSYFTNKASLQNCLWVPFKPSPMFFGGGRFIWETKFKMWNHRYDLIKSVKNLFKVCSSSPYSYSGPSSVSPYHAHCWVVMFYPRTEATEVLCSVPMFC